MTPQPYTYDYFERFLTKGTSIAPVTSLKDSKELDRCIFLRHDVDFSMQHAARLFSLEQKHNAKATFFFLTSALSYNVRDRKNRMILQDMARKGFEVGLHFDPTLYPDTPDAELTAKLDFEKGILEEIIGQEVVSVSLHNPSIHGNFLEFDTMNNAYSASTFNNNQYLSDSCYDMKGKNLLEFVEKAADKNQIGRAHV